MPTGQRIAAEVSNNNEIRIRDGLIIHQGCAASIKKNTYDSVTITNGSQGMKRIDLIVARYQREAETDKETISLVVIQGTPAESEPVVPEHTEGDIQAGDSIADMPLYQVVINGLNITEVKKVFEEITSLKELNSNKASVEIIEDSDSFQNIRIGNLQIVSGSIIPLSQGEYVQLFTLAQLKQYFGNDFVLNRFEITTRNGDTTSANVRFYEPEYWPGNQAFYQYYYPQRGQGLGVQVHYTMTYIHPAT